MLALAWCMGPFWPFREQEEGGKEMGHNPKELFSAYLHKSNTTDSFLVVSRLVYFMILYNTC